MSNPHNQLAFDLKREIDRTNVNQLADSLSVDRSCIFIILDGPRVKGESTLVSKVRTLLREFNLLAEKEFDASGERGPFGESQVYYVFAIQCKAVERCRDRLKEICFGIHLQTAATGKLFNLSDYLSFISPPKKNHGEFVEHTFVHGVGRFYRFLFDARKFLINAGFLDRFLMGLPQNCPNHLFLSGPKASKGDWGFSVSCEPIKCCDLTELAKKGSQLKLMKRAHENIERFLMLHDVKTFACEVPVWLEPSDFPDYEVRFKTTCCITGHIDILRLEENNQLGLWDYKPNAAKEKTAAQQVWFYMVMLSKRTGIPIGQIKGGYFDECDAFSVHQT